MSTLLVPIAISSQLDVTGEERIHAAGYEEEVRPTYVPAPPPLTHPVYVAVGDSGEIWVAVDKAGPWTEEGENLASFLNLLDVAFDSTNTSFVAVGNGTGPGTNTVRSSTTAYGDWTARDFPAYISATSGIDGANGTLIAVGSNGSGDSDQKIMRSINGGVSWTSIAVPSGAGVLSRVHYANDLWVIITQSGKAVWSNDDGLTWTVSAVSTYLSGITYAADLDQWMAVADSGKAWTAATPAGPWTSVSSGGAFSFLDVGYNTRTGYYAVVGSGGSQGIYTYASGVWTRVVTVSGYQFCYNGTDEDDVAYAGGVGGIHYNTTGTAWTAKVIDAATTFYGMTIGYLPDA